LLSSQWDAGIEVTEETLKSTANSEAKLTNFFLKARDVERNQKTSATINGASDDNATDEALLQALEKSKNQVDAALCDSFNTPEAMQAISALITEYNSAPKTPSPKTTLDIARYITWLIRVFGLDPKNPLDSKRIGWSGIDIPVTAEPYIYPAAHLRDTVRLMARSSELNYASIVEAADKVFATPAGSDLNSTTESAPYEQALDNFRSGVKVLAEAKAPAKDLLKMCDALRDISLWDLGIYLEDSVDPSQPALVRPLDVSLITARQEKESAAKAKAEAKAKREAEEAEKKALLAEKAKVSPEDLFRTEEYNEWDEQGVPTREKNGEEVTKSKKKKLVKEWEKQKKMHQEWLKDNQA
jgi:cysteinyl-tRNA synthetase